MSNDTWGKPAIPPALKNRGDIVTRFSGYIETQTTTGQGEIKLVLMVPKMDKYKAMLAVDRAKMLLHFEVYGREEDELEGDILDMLDVGMGDD